MREFLRSQRLEQMVGPCAARGGLSRGDTPAVSVVRQIGRLAGVSPRGFSELGKREFGPCAAGDGLSRGDTPALSVVQLYYPTHR